MLPISALIVSLLLTISENVEIHIEHRSIKYDGVSYPIDDLVISHTAKSSRPKGQKYLIFSTEKVHEIIFKVINGKKSSKIETQRSKFTGFDKDDELLIFDPINEAQINEFQLRRTVQQFSQDIADGFVSYFNDFHSYDFIGKMIPITPLISQKKSHRKAIDVKHQNPLRETPIVTIEDNYEDGNTAGITIKGFDRKRKGGRAISVTLIKNNKKYALQIHGEKYYLKDMKRIDTKKRTFPNEYTFCRVDGEGEITWNAAEIVNNAGNGEIKVYKCGWGKKMRVLTGKPDPYVLLQTEYDEMFEDINGDFCDIPMFESHSDLYGDVEYYDADEEEEGGLLSRLIRYYKRLLLKHNYN